MRRAVLLCTIIAALVCASGAVAADFTWTGGDGNWSNGASWVGGAAPSGTVGSLIFPSTACAPKCPFANDDVSGLTAATLSFRGRRGEPRAWLFGVGFAPNPTPNPLTLTAGLDAGFPDAGSANDPAGTLALPIVLGADNTWTVDGATVSGGQDFGVTGDHGLHFNLTNGATFGTNGSAIEVGPVTVTGGGTLAINRSGPSTTTASVNGNNGNPVTIDGGVLQATAPAAIGALTTTKVTTRLISGSVTVASLGLDAASTLILQGTGSGATAGKDYSQLTSTGPIDLGSAGFVFYPTPGNCAQPLGAVFTLVSTTGPLNGTFAGLPDGAVLPSPFPGASPPCGEAQKALRINYHPADTPRTVTATLQAAAAATPPPRPTAGPAATPPSGPGPGPGPGTAAESERVSRALAKLPLPKRSHGRHAKFVIPANTFQPGTKLKIALRKVGSKTATIAAGAKSTLRVPLSKKARKRLRKKGKLKLTVVISAVTPSGAKAASTRKFTLKK